MMDTNKSPEKIFSLLSVKDGLKEQSYFVGREIILSHLNGCIYGNQRSPAWIYGPRRMGKSSIAQAVNRKANDDTLVLYIDAIDLIGTGFEELLERTCNKALEKMNFENGNIYKKFEEIAVSSTSRPVLIIFDEFDKIAINLNMDNQAYLRRLATDYDRFCYLFITRLPPINIIQEFPDINSRILGICNTQKVSLLEKKDVKKICSLVSSDLGIENIKNLYIPLWKHTAGFPVAVTSLLKSLSVLFYHRDEIDDLDIEDEINNTLDEIKVDLEGFWNSLAAETRAVINGKSKIDDYINILKGDNLYNRREGFIKPLCFKSIKEDKSCKIENLNTIVVADENDDLANIECLFKLISDINQTLHLKGKPNGIYVGNKVMKFYKISRNTCNENEFKESIDYLYKLFFEGARKQKGQDKEYRFPPPIDEFYKKTKVIGDISNLRNYLFHDKTRQSDSDKANRHYKQVGNIFQRYCGYKSPHTDELRLKTRKEIIKELLNLFNSIDDQIHNIK